jgi:signal peptidase II
MWPETADTASSQMRRWLLLSAAVIVLDQISKLLVVQRFELHEGVALTSWFNLVRVHNPGAAFSFLASQSGWQRWFFVALGLVASGVMLVLLRRSSGQPLMAAALAFVLGGALGNVIDRFWLGAVVDFIQVHWAWLEPVFPGGYFPAFNLADSAITLGAGLLIADELRRMRGQHSAS